ncbi:hypothetical protein [Natronoglycomyces albus]|uniref:Uncharacterized protein n=1 Tax=Natronoglycomyces albus TaxID=2811108 RepID=A0A895XRM0_9ACTN|nr:hypothetical protein [Natronoglycomyces albus]QSB05989.1 hypothetical protein JQS30_03435 [Natronoglycomyces albus]
MRLAPHGHGRQDHVASQIDELSAAISAAASTADELSAAIESGRSTTPRAPKVKSSA